MLNATDKSSAVLAANTMAATIAALHGTTMANSSDTSLISASTAVSPDSITAATLLAAAAAHAAVTAASARRSENAENTKEDEEERNYNLRDTEKNQEVNVDDDDPDSPSTAQRNKIEDTNISRGVTPSLKIVETDSYECEGEEIIDNSTNRKTSPNAAEKEVVANTLSSCLDKHRRKARKEATKEK